MHDIVWVGIDDSSPKLLRVAWLGPESHKDHSPADLQSFNSLAAFKDYWMSEIEPQGTHFLVATTDAPVVPVALKWLRQQPNVSMTTFRLPDIVPAFQVDAHQIPEPYRDAYVLALSSLYRDRAGPLASKVASQVERIQQTLVELKSSINKLAATSPKDRRFQLG